MAFIGGEVTKTRSWKPTKINALVFLVVFGVVGGIIALILTRAATTIQIDASLPQVRNARGYGDDRVATITWDKPTNADNAGIVGYFIEYGETALGNFPYTKQTTELMTQIQPLDNSKQYTVKIYAAHGNTVQVQTPGSHDAGTAPEARGSGRVSNPVIITVTPSSARVDQLRQQMTGFFDDFNQPMGAFDELKWNQAGMGCNELGSSGAFINAQFHSHNQTRSIERADEYCDRGQFATRPRATFDITGRTEANPGEIVFDVDGANRGRDVWYLDLIPSTARNNGVPLDITSHASAFDDEAADPAMIRIVQGPIAFGGVKIVYFDANKAPHDIIPTYRCGGGSVPVHAEFQFCDAANKVSGLSPLTEIVSNAGCTWRTNCIGTIANVRRHWRVQVSPTKIKVFVDSTLVIEVPVPAEFTNTRKFDLHSTIFSYNTGKDDSGHPNTQLFHWDNFGFNGPAPTTEVHNYIEGGASGTTPYLGRGTVANPVPSTPRNTIIRIPDAIGSPAKARFMFTVTGRNYGYYLYDSADNIRINGNVYPLPNPSTMHPGPVVTSFYGPMYGNSSAPFAMYLDINPAHLVQGNNQVAINLSGNAILALNVHIELEYNKGSQPSYTQPRVVFGESVLNSFIMPVASDHDKYLFIEQNLDLASVDDGHGGGTPVCHDNSGQVYTLPKFEAENSSYCPPVTSGSDTNASGGLYLQF